MFQRFSLDMDETRPGAGAATGNCRLSVPTVPHLGFAQSFGIKSVCNVSLSSLIINTFTNKDQEKEEEDERKNSLIHKTSAKNKLWLSSSNGGQGWAGGGHDGHDGQGSQDGDFSSPLLCQVKQSY